jgi:hypothetical protein
MKCDNCDTSFIQDEHGDWGWHEVYNDDEMQKLCTECFDNVMAMCCRGSCDTYYADKYLEFDPEDDEYVESPLCWKCYDKKEASQ